MAIFKAVKKELVTEYNIKNLRKVITIIGWKIIRDLRTQTLKINQSAFIHNFVIKEGLTNGNSIVISIKTGSAIKINKYDDYKEIKIKLY